LRASSLLVAARGRARGHRTAGARGEADVVILCAATASSSIMAIIDIERWHFGAHQDVEGLSAPSSGSEASGSTPRVRPGSVVSMEPRNSEQGENVDDNRSRRRGSSPPGARFVSTLALWAALTPACAIHVTPVDPNPSPHELQVSIPELVGAYVKDPLAGDARFGHSPVRVEGIYHRRLKSFFAKVSDPGGSPGAVRCAKDDAALAVPDGRAVSMVGFVDRFFNGEVYLRQCQWTVH
jgi:hypothetical protein